MKKKMFQYAVIYHIFETNDSGAKVYKDSQIIVEPKFVMAVSEKDLVFKATREIDEKYAQDPDNVEIIIRNF